MRSAKRRYNKISFFSILPFIILAVVLMLTLGYSSFIASLAIDGATVIVSPQNDVRIISVELAGTAGNATSNDLSYDRESISGNITLPTKDSTVSYTVQVRNMGGEEMALETIVNSNSKLLYTVTGYTERDKLCDDIDYRKCTLGSITTFTVTIGWMDKKLGSPTTQSFTLGFDFEQVRYVARYNSKDYERIQKAVELVPKDGTPYTITVLDDSTEYINIAAGQSIILDIGNNTLNAVTNRSTIGSPVIEVYGTLVLSDGLITSYAQQGAVNVFTGGVLTMTGGSIITYNSQKCQAIYNEGGDVLITGTTYLSTVSTNRATVQNLANGVMAITGGTIISNNYSAVVNAEGTLTIGISGGTVGNTSPDIRGEKYGLLNASDWSNANPTTPTTFSFYDGVIKGRTRAIFDTVNGTYETNYGVVYGSETINNKQYTTAMLASLVDSVTITFEHNDGTGDTTEVIVGKDGPIGPPPSLTRDTHVLTGWNTQPDGSGTPVTAGTVASSDMTFFAQWTHKDDYYIAKIGNTYYDTVAAATAAVPSNGTATVTINFNGTSAATVDTGRDVTFNMQGHTLSNDSNAAVITCKGTCRISDGKIYTNSQNTSAVNVESGGKLYMSGGEIEATGLRQAIYNNGGRVEISGSTQLSASAPERATVQNLKSGTTIITGGTIVATTFYAVENQAGTVTVGNNDGNVDTTTPVIRSNGNYGLKNSSTFNFYDGIVMGVSGGISGTISAKDANTTKQTGSLTIGNYTYITNYLG